MSEQRYAVVGGGLAGLMTVIKLAEAGKSVDVFSLVPVKRSHSVCAQGGINGAVNTKGEGDSPDVHTYDTLRGGDFLAEQPPVKGMCEAAPGIIYLLDRMGVPFNRTPEGLLDFRRFGGTLYNRTAFAGATTGQQLLYALDEQVRRYEAEGKVRKFEYWEYLGFIQDDDGACRGVVAMDVRNMEIRAFPAEATCLCTGGPGIVFGKSTNSLINTGAAASSAYQQGAWYANPEMVQIHPTAIPGDDKLRLMSESLRGEGGRVWVPSDGRAGLPPKGQPWYFLEERYPKYKNLVPRDVASREIYDVVKNLGLGIEGRDAVYLDLTHLPAEVHKKVEGVLEIYEKFMGQDPRKVPMQIYPGMHYSMGGLWVDYEADANHKILAAPKTQSTNIPGLYAAGECEYQYHGSNRLGANSLVSCLYGGQITGPAMISYAKNRPAKQSPEELPQALADGAVKRWQEKFDGILKKQGGENPYKLGRELGELITDRCLIVKENAKLEDGMKRLDELSARYANVSCADTGRTVNQAASYINALWNMIELGKTIMKGSLLRDESRGSHFKPAFALPAPKTHKPTDDPEWMAKWKERNDKWLRTTLVRYDKSGPQITFEPLKSLSVAKPILAPEPRYYE